MTMIEVDLDVSRKLGELARQLGITRNRVLRKILKIDKPKALDIKKDAIKNIVKATPQLIFKPLQAF